MRKLQKKWPKIDRHLLEALSQKMDSELGLSFSEKLDELEKILIKYFNEDQAEKLTAKVKQLLRANLISKSDLIDLLTIPETYFFRNYRLFDTLEKSVLPELLEQKARNSEPLTIWSAGCSSGEEPYSFAMLIDDMREKLKLNLELRILGTDLNHLSLAKARKGVYSSWSFRKIPVRYLEKYFRPLDERFYKIDEKIRQAVTFQYHNLKQGPYPPSPEWTQFDLIVCRNVLIYFNKETSLEVLNNFSKVLIDDGIFISGPAETPTLYFKKLKPQIINDIIIYRKNGMQKLNKARQSKVPTPQLRKKEVKVIHPRPVNLTEAAKPKAALLSAFPENGNNFNELGLIKKLADSGKLQEAHELIQNYISHNDLDHEAYYLFGTIELELGKLKEAEKWFRKVLFLKPEHIMANFHLANLYSINGQKKESQIYFNNVLKIIDNFKQQDEIPDGDGLNVSQFKHMIQQILETSKKAS